MLSDTWFCSHLKCGKEMEAEPRSIPVAVQDHTIASELAGDTDTIMCAHKHMAESFGQLEKIVGFWEDGVWGMGQKEHALHSEQ